MSEQFSATIGTMATVGPMATSEDVGSTPLEFDVSTMQSMEEQPSHRPWGG
jgi:hypothetical protein